MTVLQGVHPPVLTSFWGTAAVPDRLGSSFAGLNAHLLLEGFPLLAEAEILATAGLL